MKDPMYIAVDLGAGSGRVFLGGTSSGELLLEEAHRFHYPPERRDGHLRWDMMHIFTETKAGLAAAVERARQSDRPIRSIGVDSWGVDYGLVDSGGNLCEDPICYRDERTQGEMEKVFERVSQEEIFARTGIQFLVFNTLFQLHAHAREGIPSAAVRLLLIPDLIHSFLTGRAVTEYTNATTTQMVNAQTGLWDFELLRRLALPEHLLAEIVPAGTDLGSLTPALAKELRLGDVRVVAPATHDTGSAFVGASLEQGWAYISSGTWSLVGVDRDAPLINSDVARHNFTNEGGAFGRTRFLKNVMGLWILESCRREWHQHGLDMAYDQLLREVDMLEDSTGLIFPDDPRFFNPPSMLQAVADQLAETGQSVSLSPPELAKVILDSLAFRYASVLRTIESLTNQRFIGVQIAGGGSQNDYLNQRTADATGLPVKAGPVEAAARGNILVQAVADGRRQFADNVRLKTFTPCQSSASDRAAQRYAVIERRYSGELGAIVNP